MCTRSIVIGLCLLALSLTAKSQPAENCTLIDSESNAPVAFASISSDRTVIYTDLLGNFSAAALGSDSCVIQRIGYETLRMSTADLQDTVFLSPRAYSLGEVTVTGSTETVEIGYHHLKTTGTSMVLSNLTHVMYFKSPLKKTRIKTVYVHTKGTSKGDPFTLSFFKAGENYEPGALIYTSDFTAPSGKNMLEIPQAGAEILMPEEGIFVGISRREVSDLAEGVLVYSTLTLANTEQTPHAYILRDNIWKPLFNDSSRDDIAYKIGLELTEE